MTAAQAAARRGVSKMTITRWVRSGRLKATRAGQSLDIAEADLAALPPRQHGSIDERLGAEAGVSGATVKRAALLARRFDQIRARPEAVGLSDSEVIKLARQELRAAAVARRERRRTLALVTALCGDDDSDEIPTGAALVELLRSKVAALVAAATLPELEAAFHAITGAHRRNIRGAK